LVWRSEVKWHIDALFRRPVAPTNGN
jgi:hypothetical protein